MRTNRLRELEEYMRRKRSATLYEISEHFDVSLNTVRRDVKEMLGHGTVRKVYGGIVWTDEDNIVPITDRSLVAIDEKRYIGKLAADLVKDGESIYIDSGTTAVNLLPFIAEKRDITIVSNNLIVFNEIQKYPGLNLLATGGLFNFKTKSFVGLGTISGLKDIRLSSAFMSATAVSLEGGAANNSMYEAEVKKAVIDHSSKIILMADHSKFDKTATITFCNLEKFDYLVTDKPLSDRYIKKLSSSNVKLIY
jgi:DeoR family myo-inositol catabolism operon transcriptional repressor